MGVFRRNEPSKELNTTMGRFVIRTETEDTDTEDRVDEPCWFCGRPVDADSPDPAAEAAALTIEPFGPGEPYRSVCHVECAERVRGLLGS
jgi:hypothetical protein